MHRLHVLQYSRTVIILYQEVALSHKVWISIDTSQDILFRSRFVTLVELNVLQTVRSTVIEDISVAFEGLCSLQLTHAKMCFWELNCVYHIVPLSPGKRHACTIYARAIIIFRKANSLGMSDSECHGITAKSIAPTYGPSTSQALVTLKIYHNQKAVHATFAATIVVQTFPPDMDPV